MMVFLLIRHLSLIFSILIIQLSKFKNSNLNFIQLILLLFFLKHSSLMFLDSYMHIMAPFSCFILFFISTPSATISVAPTILMHCSILLAVAIPSYSSFPSATRNSNDNYQKPNMLSHSPLPLPPFASLLQLF